MSIEIGTVISGGVVTTSGNGCSGVSPSWISIAITGGAPPYTVYYKLNGGVTKTIPNYVSGTPYNLGILPVGAYLYEILRITDICGNDLVLSPVLTDAFTIYQQPVANAGADAGVCGTLVTNLTAIPSVGTGTWSMVSGPGTISFLPNVNTAAVTATASVYGAYIVRWTEVNGGICSSSSDITVAYERTATAGPAQNVCGTLVATLAGNTPAVGTGTWTKVSGPGTVTFSPNANTPGAIATFSAYGPYVLKWTLSNSVFCSTNQNVAITFERGANAGADQHLCGTLAATLVGNAPAIGTGTWSFVSGPGTVAFTPNVNTPGATATVTQYGTYVFNWRIDNDGFCTSNQNMSVTYNPSGQVNQPANQVACNGDGTGIVTFTTAILGGTTTYSWTNSAPGIGLAASGTGDIAAFTAVNIGTAPVVASIVVTPSYSDGVVNCPGPAKTFTITVNPTAQVNQPSSQVVCNNTGTAAINFTTANTIGATTYSWSNSDPSIGLGASGTGNIASFTATNPGISPVIATITVVPSFSYGAVSCTGPSKTFTITVNPTGQVTQPPNQAICNNSTGTVSFTTVNGGGLTTYSWTNNNTAIGLGASGTGDISFTATNAGTAPISGTIVVTPTFTNAGKSCSGPTKTFTITVNPTGQVNQPANLAACNNANATMNFTTANTVGTTSYSWTNTNTSIGLGANGAGNLSFIALNPGTTPVTATITVTPTFNWSSTDCPGPSKSFTITVNPTPTLTSSLTPPDICSNTLFSYTPSGSVIGTTFNWNRAVIAGITPAGPTAGTNNPNETLRNQTNIPIGVTYRYTLAANGCSNTQNVIVNIKPEPVILPGQISQTWCSGNPMNYPISLVNFINPADNVTFTWPAPVLSPASPNFTGGTARPSASSANITDQFINTTGVTGTATYTVTPYKDGCAGSPETVVVTVRSQPVLDQGLGKTVCSNTVIGLTLKGAAGSVSIDSYNISKVTLDDGLSADPGNAAISNPSAPANYLFNDKYINITGVDKNVTYRVQPFHGPDCYGDPVDIVITIHPQPYIAPAQTKNVCSGVAIGKEILLSPANVPAGTVFNWPAPSLSDFSAQGSAGMNVSADPAGTIHINDQIYNYSGLPITATYNITPTVSSSGCIGTTIPVIITINPEPVPKPISGRDKICINEKSIVYDVATAPGSTFHWTLAPAIGIKTFDFNTNAIIIDAAAVPGSGNITVFETNSYGCNGDLSTLPVQVYTQAIPENITGPAIICANSTHTYSVTARAGSVYSWTIPGGAAIIGDPSAPSITVIFGNVGGTIQVKETNIAGCVTNHNPLTVSVRPLPTAIISGGGIICNGGTGSLFVDFTGTGPYVFTYAINGVSQAPVNTASDPYTLSVTQAGTYTIVNVSDATGCNNNGFGSAFISYYPKPTGIISGGTTLCRGASATLTMTFTGTPPYTFTYTDGTTPLTVPNFPGAVYTVSVTPTVTSTYTLTSLTDANSCTGTISGSALITVNDPASLTLGGTNLTCNNDNTGAVDLTATGNGPFGFVWSGPGGFTANTEDLSGLKAGTYSVTVTDTNGCTATGSITLTQPGPVTATLSSTNIFCFGSHEGTITISAPSGGSGAYEYTINGGTSWQASGNFTGLDPGIYDVRIRDVLAPVCNKILNGALVLTGPPVLNATYTVSNINCYNANDGSIIISGASGGFGTYEYTIHGTTGWQGSGNFTNLTPGTYDVRIRDAAHNTCVVVLNGSVVITQPTELTATVNRTNVSCFGLTDGTITIAGPAGGSGTFEYSINGGGSWQASGLFTSVAPGTYNVQIRDAGNTSCYKVLNSMLLITQPAVLRALFASTMITCNGANDGTISITGATGGTGSYEYTVHGTTGWQASGLFTGLTPGSYDVRIRDAAQTACEIILNSGLDITEPTALSGMVMKSDITCFGAANGNITITNSQGGYGTYEYSINNGGAWQSSNVFPGLSSGTYNVWMRDRLRTNCAKQLDPAVVVVEPGALAATVAGTNVTCFNANDGTITISAVTGGFGTYQYSINGGASWQGSGNYVNLSPGAYDIRIRDAASIGCFKILNPNLVLTQPPVLFATVTRTNLTCFGASDGTITINGATGGYGTYEFTIDGGATWQSSNIFNGLLPGFYNVKIRDAAQTGCIITINGSLSITEPPALNANVAKTNVTCNSANNGTITISSPSGGYGTYEFSINGGSSWQSSGSYINLTPGTYIVKIRDAVQTSCEITLNPSLVITEPAVLAATMTYTNVACFGANNGTISISGAAGGSGTYEYSINGGSTWTGLSLFTNLSPLTYDVKMRDAVNTGCILTLNGALTITQPPVLNAAVAKTDITCFGANNGTISVTGATGGYGTYEYTINGGGSWQASGIYSGLGAGNYNVQIRDAAHPACIIVLNNSLSIGQPSVLNAVITPTMISCNSANDGIINITAPVGGYGTYEYSINGGTDWFASGLFTGLSPAVYDVRIRDAANIGCVIILNSALSITEPAALNALLSSTNITCFGANNGTITVSSPSGGYGTYDFTIDGGTNWQATGTFTNLLPGTYNIQIRDKVHNACILVLNSALVITEPATLAATVVSTNVTCFGANNGTITISGATGGYGTYQYSVDGGVTWLSSGNFIGLIPGSYNVRIRDAAHISCSIILNPAVLITQPAVLAASVTSTNVTCSGANDATITISGATGGYGTYEYSVNGGSTWQASGNFISLTPGFYNVQMRDAASIGCILTLNGSLRITEPGALGASLTKNDITCFGSNDGRITISLPAGGYGTYEYSIDGGLTWQLSGLYTALTPNTYDVRIRDAAHIGCFLILNPALVIIEPALLNASFTSTDVTCNGANNGTITITGATGGFGTYQYSINGGTTWFSSGNFTSVAPGTYNVQIRDAAANPLCKIILNPALIITQPAALNATLTKTNVTCFAGGDGTIIITSPAGGYGTYEYTINGGGSWQSSGTFTGMGPGSYNVQMRDGLYPNCVKVLNASLLITQPAVLNAVVTYSNITCNGANDGIINISAPTGGYGTYEFSTDGGTIWQSAGLFTGLTPGTYDVRIRDAGNIACVMILNPSLFISEPVILDAMLQSTNVTCNGANDGTITITNPTGGYGTFEYTIDGGVNWKVSGGFINLIPGTYNVQIRDKAHTSCVKILNAALTITQPSALSATVASSNVTCFGANNGTIAVSNPLGGYGTYSYTINGGASWQPSGTFANLAPGTYNVRIRDAANTACLLILNPALIITEPAILSATVSSTAITCNGASDGTITIAGAAGGYGTYEYSVNGGASWQGSGNFTALMPGFYNVQIRDAANTGCIIILNGSLQMTQPASLAAFVTSTNVTCNGSSDGTIKISSPAGGYGTYEYTVNGGTDWQSSGSFTGLAPASYDVRIRDAAHTACVLTLNAALLITEPAILSATVTSTDVTCSGAGDGSISINTPLGGYGTYQYSVNGGTSWQGTGTFTNLIPANYNVRIRDAGNTACVIILNPALAITQPAVLNATVTKTNVSCFGGGDGSITISAPTGGYGTYEYSINGGGSWEASGNFTLLGPGSYNVRIRDAAHTGCVKVLNASLPITQPAVLNAVITTTNVSCFSANDGIINVTAPTGGSGTYGYTIDGGATWQPSGLFNGLIPGTYNVQIRDAANTVCVITLNASLLIAEPNILSAAVTRTNITCNGANDGTISITSPTGGYGTFEFSDDGGSSWQASGNFINLVPASYNVQIRDKAHTGCVIILNPALVLTEPAVLTATTASTNVSCFGANNGTITITNPLGGYGTYSYSINGGTTWQPTGTFTNLAPSTYNVQIRDAAHIACMQTLNAALLITQPPLLSATVNNTNVTCNSAADGIITVTNPLGGLGTYQYTVDGGSTWQNSGTFNGLMPGFYNVQIRDAANISCHIILNGSLQVTQPAVLSAFVSKTNVTCNGGSDGTIAIIGASGGYGTYEYSIDGGGAWQASGSFTGLLPATYNVQIRDAAHAACVVTLNATLVITQPAILSATVTSTNITCSGAADGTISITSPLGGYGSYQFSVNGGTSWQGSGIFTNLAPASYNVQIRDAGNTSCVIILNPALVLTQPAVLSASLAHTNVTCFGGNDGTITISSAAGGYGTYEYSINGGGSWQSSGNFTLLTPGTYNVIIRDAAHQGCIVVLSSSYPISQPALLAATVTKTEVTCNGANDGTITISSPSGGSGTYEYSIDGGVNWIVSGIFTNLVPGTYDVRIRDAANILCSAILYPNMVITEPILLALTSTGDITLNCFGDTNGSGTFFGSGGTFPYSFHVITNTTGATLAAPGFNSQTFFNAGAGTITIAVTDLKGCFAETTINVTQPALLTPGTIAASQVLCAGDNPAQLTETVAATGGPGAYSYQWQYGSTAAGPFITIAGATANIYTPPAGANNTIYYRRMVTSGFCPPVYSNIVEVLVNPRPVAVLSGGETICPSETSILKVNMMVGTGPFELDIDNLGTITGYISGADITVSPLITTTYTLLRVRDANGCEVLSPSTNLLGSAKVTVRSLPAITTSPANKTSCEFGMVAFSVAATGSDLTYQWYLDTGSGFNPVSDGGIYFGATSPVLNLFGVTRTMNGYVYHVVVTGCSSSVTSADATLTVNTVPEISAQPRDTTACMSAGAAFAVTATGTGITYQWQVNKGTGFTNVVDDANFSGSNLTTLTITNTTAAFNNYIFRIIVTGTCGVPVYSNFAVLRINIPPTVTLNPANKAACDGTGPVVFTANGSGLIDSLRWQVFSGGIWSDVHDDAIYGGSTSQQLTLFTAPIALNGNQYRLALKAKCTIVTTTGATLTVNANPVVNFSAVDPIHACGNVPLVINGNPTAGSGTWSTHLWTGDVGPLSNYFIQSPTFNSQIAGTYALNYKVKDSKGCYGDGNVNVIVDAPDASFTQDKSSGCTPATVTFTKDMTGITKFWWDFGDGSPRDSVNANPAHTFTNSNASSIAYYDVKLTVMSSGGCLDSFTSSITVYPLIDATFTATPNIVCSGNQITFTTLPGASRYFWDFGDGVSGYFANTTNHLYTNFTAAPVVHTVTLTTTSFYNCTDVRTMNVTVMPVPLPQFTAFPVSQIYSPAGNQVTFTNSTNAGTWTWLWNFGDGATSSDQNPVHNYTALGTFNVVLNVSNANCSDSVKHSVTITPIPPVAAFDPIPSGCSPLEIIINNTSLNTDTPGTSYMWDFGDGGISTSKNPSYVYTTPGIFRVELTVKGPGGTSTFSQVVNAYPSPKANFQVTPALVFVNDEKVRCFNLSQGADSYVWEFGDGDTSMVKEPFHKYMEEGVYDITLWAYVHNVVNNETIVCTDKFVLSPAVTVETAGELRFSTVFTPNLNGEIDMDHLPTGTEIDQFFFPPVREKVINYKLQVFNRWGVLIFETHDINRPWNGYYQHKLCQQGVYVWYVEGKYANGKPFKKVGDVTLLH
jgi:PKD repeat protein